MVLDAKGRPWPEMTLLDVAREAGAPPGLMQKIIERLVNQPVLMRMPTGLLDARGKPLYKEI